MPLYEYECDACAHRFEKIQKFSDPRETICPKCGGPIHKLASSPAIQFKGSGFYITDYAKKDNNTKDTKGTKDAKGAKEENKSGGDAKETTSSGASSASSEKSSSAETKSSDSKPSSDPK